MNTNPPEPLPLPKFKIGDKVDKQTGYSFPGIIVSVFYNTNNKIRYVVEMDNYHLLHIFNEDNLKLRE